MSQPELRPSEGSIAAARPLFLVVLAVLTTALVCSDAVTLTFVNTSNADVSVYESADTDDFIMLVPAHSRKSIRVHEKYWRDQVVLRRHGEIFQTVPLPWEELSEQGDSYEYTITDTE